MIKHLGTKTVAIEKLKLDGDWKTRLASPRVADRAKSIQRFGLLQAPIMRASDRRLITGRDRVAALVTLGTDDVEVHVVECSDSEAEQIASAENLERRHLSAGELAQETRATVAALAESIAKENPEKRLRGPGRGGSAQADAERELAAQQGVQPSTIARRRQRAEKRSAAGTAPKGGLAKAPAPKPRSAAVETFGLPVEEDWLASLVEGQRLTSEGLNLFRRVALVLGALEKVPHHPARLQRARETLATARHELSGMRPWAVCPWCKGQSPAIDACSACEGTAFAVESQKPACPPELLDRNRVAFYDHGELTPLGSDEDMEIE